MVDKIPRARPTYDFAIGARHGSDIDELHRVLTAAFEDGVRFKAMFPGAVADPVGYRQYRINAHLKGLRENPQVEWGKVKRQDTGEVVAVGKWEFMPRGVEAQAGKAAEGEKEKVGHGVEESAEARWNGVNETYLEEFFGKLAEHHKRQMGDRRHYIVHLLATLPSAQGQGAVSPIIKHVLGRAQAEGVPVYIESSPAGLPVYRRYGWREVGGMRIQLPSGEWDDDTVLMLWEPES